MMSRRVGFCLLAVAVVSLTVSACGGAQARMARHMEKGQTYLAAGNFEKARVEFQNALQISPVDPEARYEVGVVDEKLGKIREAAQFYQGTIDVSADHLGAHTNLARLYLFSGDVNKALELIQPALDKHPDDSELLTLRAAARVKKQDLSGALSDGLRAVQLNPQNEDAYGTLAGIYMAQKEPEKAQTFLEDAVKKIPKSVDLRLALAQIYASANRLADTERLLTEIVGLRPNEKAQRIRLAQFYARQNQNDAAERVLRDAIKAIPQDRDLKLSLIDFLAAHRSPEVAEKELQGMIAADPKDFEMKFALAKFYEVNRQSDRAEKIYREVINTEKLDPAGLVARDRLAGLLGQRGDVKSSEELIAQVLAKSPRDTDALLLRGTIELSKKDPKSAIADLRSVLRDQPNAIGVLRMLARAHMANGEPAIAEETMRRAVEANPKDPSVRLDLAQLLAELGKPDQAKTALQELVKDQPNNVPALDTLFKVSAGLKDFDTAKSAADALVATQPKLALGYVYEGMLAEENKRTEEAIRLYGQAADIQPDAIEPLQSQIRMLVQAKRQPEAMKRLDAITAEQPKLALAPLLKAELLRSQNNPAESEAAYRVAIARAPTWWMPYRGLAELQFAAKNPEAALATLRNAEPTVDGPDQLGLRIAGYYESAGKPQEAIHEYEDIVSRNPQSEVAVNNLAMLLVTYQKDSTSLDRAKSLSARFADSANPSYLDTYGWVLYKHGEAAVAVPVLERVVSKAPNAPVALYHLGMAQSQSGNSVQALGNLTKAVKSGEKFSGFDEAKATLDKLGKLSALATPKT
jgi:tetratricopeptide (TPR) repeat protein